MRVEDFLEKPLVLEADSIISKAAAQMFEQSKREAVVMKGEDFSGMLYARNILKKNIARPEKTRITKLIRTINPLMPDTPVEEVMNYLLVNNLRAVPVRKYGDEKGIFLINRKGVLSAVRGNPVFKNKTAEDVMTFPYCITPSDNLSTARAMMRDLNISCLPVVENNKTVGIIDELTLLGIISKPRYRETILESHGETLGLDIEAKSVMKKSFHIVSPDTKLGFVADIMIKEDTPTVMVESDGKLVGIITRKDVLKSLGRVVAGAHVRISGIHEEDPFIKSIIDKDVDNFISKISKIFPIDHFVAHVERHKEAGERTKYSVNSRLITSKGVFFASDYAWDLTKAFGSTLDILERAVKDKKRKFRDQEA